MKRIDQPDSKQNYYERRAAQERALAERALDPSARLIHIELASRYAAIAAETSAH